MPLEKHYSLVHADKVIDLIQERLDSDYRISIRAWSNGREQGYHLESFDGNKRACVFAQQRNSDQLLVVCGIHTEFDIQTNQPTDGVWEHRQVFAYDKEAANQIVAWLTDQIVGPHDRKETIADRNR